MKFPLALAAYDTGAGASGKKQNKTNKTTLPDNVWRDLLLSLPGIGRRWWSSTTLSAGS